LVKVFSLLDLSCELDSWIENIFKFFRLDFFHRMTYLDAPEARPFVVKVSAQIIL